MNIDLSKHGDTIIKAYNDVVNDKTSTDWLVSKIYNNLCERGDKKGTNSPNLIRFVLKHSL